MKDTYMIRTRMNQERKVVAELEDKAIDAWCGLVLTSRPDPKRRGRKSLVLWEEHAAFPTYVFAELAVYDFYRARALDEVTGIPERVPESLLRNLRQVQKRVDDEHAAAQRARERGSEPPPPFHPGEALEAVGGPLMGLMGDYIEAHKDADGWHVIVDTPLGI